MGKRSFKATKSAKKWRKGESCASNPTQRKFRDEVTKQTITPFQTANVSKKCRSGKYLGMFKNTRILIIYIFIPLRT